MRLAQAILENLKGKGRESDVVVYEHLFDGRLLPSERGGTPTRGRALSLKCLNLGRRPPAAGTNCAKLLALVDIRSQDSSLKT
jgi:hypothetical protein